jgi:hypothetical protein
MARVRNWGSGSSSCRVAIAALVLAGSPACRVAEAPPSVDLPARPETTAGHDHGTGLLTAMRLNAYLLHKLALSVDARNQPLAAFYAEELNEVLDEMGEQVLPYEGHDIAGLTRAMLTPAIRAVQEQLAAGAWADAAAGVEAVVAACNQCHVATDHGFIQVTSGAGTNPFNQVFDP